MAQTAEDGATAFNAAIQKLAAAEAKLVELETALKEAQAKEESLCSQVETLQGQLQEEKSLRSAADAQTKALGEQLAAERDKPLPLRDDSALQAAQVALENALQQLEAQAACSSPHP